jgi:hypothetical protein
MNTIIKSRTVIAAIAVTAAALLLGTDAAHSSWTVGDRTAAPGVEDLTVNQVTVLDPISPGRAAQTLSGTFDNRSDGPVYVTSVTVGITAVESAPGVPAVGCSASDFNLTGAVMPVAREVAAGNDQGAWTGAAIAFNTTEADQNACKGVSITLSYVVA